MIFFSLFYCGGFFFLVMMVCRGVVLGKGKEGKGREERVR